MKLDTEDSPSPPIIHKIGGKHRAPIMQKVGSNTILR
jgi:hypothetical protein